MKFASSYEPGEYETDIYAAWEASGAFQPTTPTVPVDDDGNGVDDRFETEAGGARAEDGVFEGVRRPLPRIQGASPVKTGASDPSLENTSSAPAPAERCYSIVMPPPNANGNLHIGHGLTIALEDSLTRYHRLRGQSAWYIPGADHAGFETWVVYEKTLESTGHTRFEFSRDALYARVWDFVAMQRGNMELQLRALGASCSWGDLTFTLDENVIDRVYTTFEKMWNDGLIYRGEKLVNFCPKHRTAFADIEVEHQDEKGTLWEIEYKVIDEAAAALLHNSPQSKDIKRKISDFSRAEVERRDIIFDYHAAELLRCGELCNKAAAVAASERSGGSIIVSTTRPETLFGDMAIAVNPDDSRYKDLIGKKVHLPLAGRAIPIIADEHADPAYGTGAVKITPAHDFDDFEVGARHGLEKLQVISEDGVMINVPEQYAGLTPAECRQQVLKDLKAQGLLVGEKQIEHSVAHCYKCGTVLEPTLKAQWFIDVKKLAKTAIQHLENNEITFHPESKQKVLINYLKGLKDWNISRQIPWGIAIPMFRRADLVAARNGVTRGLSEVTTENEGTSPVTTEQRSERNASSLAFPSEAAPSALRETEQRSDPSRENTILDAATGMPDWIFDRRTHLQQIEKSGVTYIRDEDTFDTWFSSSHWPIVCTDWSEENPTPYYPLNVMETGADILFAWVARMIMMGLYVTGEVPFKEVYLHGLVLDAHGKKMSKSKGNVINPMDMVAKYGSDAFRLGILRGRSAGMNQAFSENSVISGRNLCNKLWNISRLIQSIVDEDEPESDGEEVTDGAPSANIIAEFEGIQSAAARGRAPAAHGDGPAGRSPRISNNVLDCEPRTLQNLAAGSYTTNSMGEDWICREINACIHQIEDCMATYRFAEAVEVLQTTIWDKYADWFLESQKIYRNVPLLKITLEHLLIALHPFAPFVTEAIWQNLSWTHGMIINAKWPSELIYDPITAEQFERLMLVVSEVRSTLQALPGSNKGKKYALMYDNDALVEDNLLLIKTLAKLPTVEALQGSPRGLRLALANHELYLDVPAEVVAAYKEALTEKILAVGRELNALNARMQNPSYVERAPAALVKETEDAITSKEQLISRLKTQLKVI